MSEIRKRVAVLLVTLVSIGWAGSVAAAPSLSLTWTGTTGLGATGGTSIEAEDGDILTLDVIVTIDPAGFTGVAFDLVGTGVLAAANTLIAGAGGPAECPSPPNLAPGTCFSATFKSFSPLAFGVLDSGSDTLNYDVAGLTAEFVPSTMTVGRGVFVAQGSSGGSVSTFFASGVGGVTDGGFNFSVPTAATADWIPLILADIDVAPLLLDFGDTLVDATDLLMATITNNGTGDLTVTNVSLVSGSDPAFQLDLAPAPSTVLAPGGVADIEVSFTPDASGPFTGTLRVESNDPDEGIVDVALVGNGVALDEEAMELLDFFDAADIDSTRGNRDLALRGLLESAGDFIDRGQLDQACQILDEALLRVDGIEPPDSLPDFVEGPDAEALAMEIEDLQDSVGCDDTIPGPPACGLGFELVLLLPAAAWLRGRRRRA